MARRSFAKRSQPGGKLIPLGEQIGYVRAEPLTAVTRSNLGCPRRQLVAVFGKLADEAGLQLTVAARRKAAAVLEQAERGDGSGNARLAVRMLNEARAVQARRVARGSASDRGLAVLVTITEHDIPDRLLPDAVARDDDRRGPYL